MNANVQQAAAHRGEEGDLEWVSIPLTALVRCPLVEFRMRAVAAHCPGCEHFKGLVDNFPGATMSFDKRYTVSCAAEPVRRQLFEAA